MICEGPVSRGCLPSEGGTCSWAAVLTIDVRRGEMDAPGQVNNIRYLAWLGPG
jgi:hypothetical protein